MITMIELFYNTIGVLTTPQHRDDCFYNKTKRTLLMYVEKHTRPPQVNSYSIIMISDEGCVANTRRDY